MHAFKYLLTLGLKEYKDDEWVTELGKLFHKEIECGKKEW